MSTINDEIEQTQPGIFHIHIDAQQMTKRLYDFAVNQLAFYDSDFNGHPEGYVHFEPKRHMTLKLENRDEFFLAWNELESFVDGDEFNGYIEGEYIPFDEFIPFREYKNIPIPFTIDRRKLSGEQGEEFRQTEIHITMEKDKSHPQLMKRLLDAGFYGAYIPKPRGTFLVLTMQGFIKEITPLYTAVKEYIEESGGAYMCTIKEERAIRHKLYGLESNNLPEIASKVVYHK